MDNIKISVNLVGMHQTTIRLTYGDNVAQLKSDPVYGSPTSTGNQSLQIIESGDLTYGMPKTTGYFG